MAPPPAARSWPAGWDADDHEAALDAYRASLSHLGEDWPRPGRGSARGFFETAFDLGPRQGEDALVTAYFEPVLAGSRRRHGRFQWPLLGLPPDLVPGAPWHSRAEIRARDLGRGTELVWLDDPLDAFLAQVQGSLRVALDDGRTLRLGYAGRNGHPYRSIGAELSRRGVAPADAMTLDTIRDWCRAHPDALPELLDLNPSYVFFRVLDLPDSVGPPGSLGVPLTAGRSIAVDPAHVPLGSPVWVSALGRLMLAQDTGSAIRGPNRADVFLGSGPAAGDAAGRMRRSGHLRVLSPRGRAAS